MQNAEQLSSPYIPEKATIKKITQLTETEKLFLMSIDSGRSLGHAPGQFVEVSLFGIGEGPISISSPPVKDFQKPRTRSSWYLFRVTAAASTTGATTRTRRRRDCPPR